MLKLNMVLPTALTRFKNYIQLINKNINRPDKDTHGNKNIAHKV